MTAKADPFFFNPRKRVSIAQQSCGGYQKLKAFPSGIVGSEKVGSGKKDSLPQRAYLTNFIHHFRSPFMIEKVTSSDGVSLTDFM